MNDVNDELFEQIDRWLTTVLRYYSTRPLSVDELYQRAKQFPQKFGKPELLWVASTATKHRPRGPSMYRFVVERNETGIFIGLNGESEQQHWMRKRRREEKELPPGDGSENEYQQWGCCKEDPYG